MEDKLRIDERSLLLVLQLALEGAMQNKEAALKNYNKIERGFHVNNDIDAGMAMAIKEISDSIDKYLRSADNSIDKLIKIAKLISDTMIKQGMVQAEELTDEERDEMSAKLAAFINTADEAKDN